MWETLELRHDKNQQSECAPSEDCDQPGHPPSLIRVFAVRMKKAWVLSCPLSAQRRLWSDWADAQADLSLPMPHTHFAGFIMSRLISWKADYGVWKTCFWIIAIIFVVVGISCSISKPVVYDVLVLLKGCILVDQSYKLMFYAENLMLYAVLYMSHVMGKPVFAICEQQRCRWACAFRQSDQHICFRCLDGIISLGPIVEISNL